MTLEEWIYEEEQRLMNGIDSWKEFQENKENRENNLLSELKGDNE